MARRKNAGSRVHGGQYRILNEGAVYVPELAPGKTEVWYWKTEFARDLGMGLNWLQTHPEWYPEPYNLSKSHVMLGRVDSKDPEKLFWALQGENWSPNGEARSLIKSLGLDHTSVSVGDILVIDGMAYFCDNVGWVKIGRVDKMEA